MDANGERLTTAGWKKGNTFFLNPGPPPYDPVLGVMKGEIVGKAKVTGTKAECGQSLISSARFIQLDNLADWWAVRLH
jgi:hypothetical protein